MKKLIILLGVWMGLMSFVFAQNESDNITLCVYLPQDSEIPDAALQYLENKLETLVSTEGNAGFVICDRFILTAKIDVLNKDVVAGPPQKVSQTLSITLQIGDIQEHKLFSTTTLTAIGIGTNLTKSYTEAFKSLNKNDKQILDFLSKGKEKVLSYYQQNCDAICRTASLLAKNHQYDEALYRLASLPDLGNDCSEKALLLMADIAGRKVNADGRNLLNQAKLAWAKAQNDIGATEAVSFLQQISPLADCYPEVKKLITEMTTKIAANEEHEWQLQLKQYNDHLQTERQRMQNDKELNKMRIAAARDAAVAFAENLPQEQIILW